MVQLWRICAVFFLFFLSFPVEVPDTAALFPALDTSPDCWENPVDVNWRELSFSSLTYSFYYFCTWEYIGGGWLDWV